MKSNRYFLIKNSIYKKGVIFNNNSGLDITPKNSDKYGIHVNKLIVMHYIFINAIIKKRIKSKLELYLKYIIEYIDDGEDDGEDDGDSINQILNDMKRYKQILNYKYNKYLEQKYIDALSKKMDLIEKELSIKLYFIHENQPTYEEEMVEHRRR